MITQILHSIFIFVLCFGVGITTMATSPIGWGGSYLSRNISYTILGIASLAAAIADFWAY